MLKPNQISKLPFQFLSGSKVILSRLCEFEVLTATWQIWQFKLSQVCYLEIIWLKLSSKFYSKILENHSQYCKFVAFFEKNPQKGMTSVKPWCFQILELLLCLQIISCLEFKIKEVGKYCFGTR